MKKKYYNTIKSLKHNLKIKGYKMKDIILVVITMIGFTTITVSVFYIMELIVKKVGK